MLNVKRILFRSILVLTAGGVGGMLWWNFPWKMPRTPPSPGELPVSFGGHGLVLRGVDHHKRPYILTADHMFKTKAHALHYGDLKFKLRLGCQGSLALKARRGKYEAPILHFEERVDIVVPWRGRALHMRTTRARMDVTRHNLVSQEETRVEHGNVDVICQGFTLQYVDGASQLTLTGPSKYHFRGRDRN